MDKAKREHQNDIKGYQLMVLMLTDFDASSLLITSSNACFMHIVAVYFISSDKMVLKRI